MLLLPICIFGLWAGLTYDDLGGTLYFVALTIVCFLGIWDAIND